MVEYGFVEGLDFKLPQMGELENAGLQTKIDYSLSLDIANVLAMVEKSDQSRAALLARTGQTRRRRIRGHFRCPPTGCRFCWRFWLHLVFFGGLCFSCHGP
ncbi:antA/AntB antirepressor family protein [Methylovulum psychrotolerans]|nr:antA/AntB antirepressor family protein [Methylovulum psychrotolerans]MBT9100515.1 antA/AntB antirepressor family protein [Methylovulum psychrotolerans]MBT9100541.1 antA/AntB antirepressor family protein [Methylovulum psychrotolerans]